MLWRQNIRTSCYASTIYQMLGEICPATGIAQPVFINLDKLLGSKLGVIMLKSLK